MLARNANLIVAAVALALLPALLSALGLTVTSATDVVILALACMALNLLVGYTGLVSFGHGAWFGLRRLCGGAGAAAAVSRWGLVLAIPAAVLVTLAAIPWAMWCCAGAASISRSSRWR